MEEMCHCLLQYIVRQAEIWMRCINR
uniref:Uncharacterized protein n=1 Tax=Rhizophora mucronata TaxID=61149 RepID=A0A2P2N4V2_RHIMU